MAQQQHDSQFVSDHQQRLKHLEDAMLSLRGQLVSIQSDMAEFKVRESARAGAEAVTAEMEKEKRVRLEQWQSDVSGKLEIIGNQISAIENKRKGLMTAVKDTLMVVTLAAAMWQMLGTKIAAVLEPHGHPTTDIERPLAGEKSK